MSIMCARYVVRAGSGGRPGLGVLVGFGCLDGRGDGPGCRGKERMAPAGMARITESTRGRPANHVMERRRGATSSKYDAKNPSLREEGSRVRSDA